MDPFQIRLECLSLVRRLTASQQSIQKVVDFAMRHATSAADDVWDCLVSECARAGLNAKLNILLLLDALLLSIVDPVGHAASCNATQAQASAAYLAMALRDLQRIVDAVVPDNRADAVRLNATSTQKVLESWRNLQLFDAELLRDMEDQLEARKNSLASEGPHKLADFSRQDVQRRMEEDRERHKRLRERAWILPAKSYQNMIAAATTAASSRAANPTSSASGSSVPSVHSLIANNSSSDKAKAETGRAGGGQNQLDAVEIDFEEMWDSISDLNDDDLEALDEDDAQWWGSSSASNQILKSLREERKVGSAQKGMVSEGPEAMRGQDDGWTTHKRAAFNGGDRHQEEEEAWRQRRRGRREEKDHQMDEAVPQSSDGHQPRWRSTLTGPSGFRPVPTTGARR